MNIKLNYYQNYIRIANSDVKNIKEKILNRKLSFVDHYVDV